MQVLFYVSPDSRPATLRRELEQAGHRLTLAEHPAFPLQDEIVCCAVLPPELDAAARLVAVLRRQLPAEVPLLAVGPWLRAAEIEPLLQKGADDFLTLGAPAEELQLRLAVLERQARARLAQMNSAQDRARLLRMERLETLATLIGSIAHDYNNLLTAIQGNAELALMGPPADATLCHALSEIEKCARRAAELTRQLLAYSAAAPDSTLVRALSLNPFIREMGELLHVAVRRNCKLSYHLERGLPALPVDAGELRQLLLNLVLHLNRRLPAEGGDIRLRTALAPAEGGAAVVLEVSSKAAQPGSSDDSGLDAAAAIAQAHHGVFSQETPDSGGLLLRVSLPAAIQDADTPAPLLAEHSAQGTVLLVDDDESVRKAAARLLRRAGYTVFDAASAAEGLQVFRQVGKAIDAMIVDMSLGCRGLVERVRQARADMKIVVWSGFPSETSRNELAGIADLAFVEKPAQFAEVSALLDRVLLGARESARS